MPGFFLAAGSAATGMLDRVAATAQEGAARAQARPWTTIMWAALALGGALAAYDKHSWAAYGTGGTPPTWWGYVRNNVLLRARRLASGRSLHDSRPWPLPKKHDDAGVRFLEDLPERGIPRPASTRWTLPQRQADYSPEEHDEEMLERLHALAGRLAAEHPEVLRADLSAAEGRSTQAVYAHGDLDGRHTTAADGILGNEIAHVHPQEHSLHVWLAEADAAEVVRKGWGERFPLASLGMVHPGLAFVYAPHDARELAVVERIVAAGVEYLTGKRI